MTTPKIKLPYLRVNLRKINIAEYSYTVSFGQADGGEPVEVSLNVPWEEGHDFRFAQRVEIGYKEEGNEIPLFRGYIFGTNMDASTDQWMWTLNCKTGFAIDGLSASFGDEWNPEVELEISTSQLISRILTYGASTQPGIAKPPGPIWKSVYRQGNKNRKELAQYVAKRSGMFLWDDGLGWRLDWPIGLSESGIIFKVTGKGDDPNVSEVSYSSNMEACAGIIFTRSMLLKVQ